MGVGEYRYRAAGVFSYLRISYCRYNKEAWNGGGGAVSTGIARVKHISDTEIESSYKTARRLAKETRLAVAMIWKSLPPSVRVV